MKLSDGLLLKLILKVADEVSEERIFVEIFSGVDSMDIDAGIKLDKQTLDELAKIAEESAKAKIIDLEEDEEIDLWLTKDGAHISIPVANADDFIDDDDDREYDVFADYIIDYNGQVYFDVGIST